MHCYFLCSFVANVCANSKMNTVCDQSAVTVLDGMESSPLNVSVCTTSRVPRLHSVAEQKINGRNIEASSSQSEMKT